LGLDGQFIVMHPGLDLVIAAQNVKSDDGVRAPWNAVRPALAAKDRRFRGDEGAFCRAYAANDYAPDF
jgi:hypothetical protein